MAHSPGPWKISRHNAQSGPLVISTSDGQDIAELCYLNGPEADDARLIAAAPQLLEACEAACVYEPGWITLLIKAIRTAKGE